MKLSVVIITKNAEELLADAILSVDFADEVIIIDDGSKDRTKEIAKYLKAKVFTHITSSFANLRNFGLQKAHGEWILYIDSDERLTPKLISSIKHNISGIDEMLFAAFTVRRKNYYFGKHEWPHIEKIERLFQKKSLNGWRGELHESPIVDGQIGELDGFLDHFTHRNITEMLVKTIVWSGVEARLRFEAGHPKMVWWRFFRVMLSAFLESYVRQEGWKAGVIGLIESIYQAFSMFITYARLWEMQIKK